MLGCSHTLTSAPSHVMMEESSILTFRNLITERADINLDIRGKGTSNNPYFHF